MSNLTIRVSQDVEGRLLSFGQLMAQARIIEEVQAQRAEIQDQITVQHGQLAALQRSNLIAEQLVELEQNRLELELLKEKRIENEQAQRSAEANRLKYLPNVLAEATLELEGLTGELDRPTTSLLYKPAALLQAKLKVLEDQKDGFTDHSEILAFHRLKKQLMY